jgi:hypothetical protein
MYLSALESDQLYTWSDENYKNPEPAHRRFAETPPGSPPTAASTPSDPPRFSHRALQTMRQAGMQMRRRPGARPQVLLVGQLSRLAAADGLRAAGIVHANGRVPDQLPSSPRDPGGDLRDQPRTTAPTRGAIRACHAPSGFCHSDVVRCGIGRRAPSQYAGSLAGQRFRGFAYRGGRG